MLKLVEHEKSFITSGPGLIRPILMSKMQLPSSNVICLKQLSLFYEINTSAAGNFGKLTRGEFSEVSW